MGLIQARIRRILDEIVDEAPTLPPDLRVNIPRSSLRYLLHHLKFVYAYTRKKPTFTNPKKRHQRIRKYMIEIDRAVKLQDAVFHDDGTMEVRGEHVLVITGEFTCFCFRGGRGRSDGSSTAWGPGQRGLKTPSLGRENRAIQGSIAPFCYYHIKWQYPRDLDKNR
jgi:hypothetical protein